MIAPDSISLPDALVAALSEWCRFYDDTLTENGYEWPSPEVEQTFVEKGRDLARQVAGALGDDFLVQYFNEASGEREPVPKM